MRNKKIEIIIEFKYEPSHKRAEDFPASKLEQCFVFWGGKSNKHSVEQDIRHVKDFVKTGKTKIGFSIFIDEGRFFWRKKPHPGSQWENWGDVAVLISQVG